MDKADLVVIEGIPKPTDKDRPMTKHGLSDVVCNFFAGVHRSNDAQRQSRAYTLQYREEIHVYLDVLEKQGYLTVAKQRKHILTQFKICKVLNAFWSVMIPPIKHLSMGLVLTLEVITGLHPGELF